MTAAQVKPRLNAAAAPSRVASDPAVLATAESTATPRAAPTSCPVIRKPEATPAWEDGMPAIEVTDTGTKTMPTPIPWRPGRGAGRPRRRRPLAAKESRAAAAPVTTRPDAATVRGARWASR